MVMMELLPDVLNMSITASVAICFVVLARLGLRKAPKVFSYALWSVVLFRLVCPVSFTVDFSVLRLAEVPAAAVSGNTSRVEFLPEDLVFPGEHLVNGSENPTEKADAVDAPPADGEIGMGLGWITGVTAMLLWGLWSLMKLKKKIDEAAPIAENVWEADGLHTAFVMGLIRPRIWIPSGLGEQERQFILLHEKHHVRRLDHLWKLAAYVALCIHWFNPLVWLAFYLAERDMEMSCDEAVLKELGTDSRCDYSQTLLRISSGRKWTAAMPLAFGEGNVKERVVNVLNWKKPRMWVSIVCGILCVALLAACGGNPGVEAELPTEPTEPPKTTRVDVGQAREDMERIKEEEERIREEVDRLNEATRTVRADFTDYANIQIELPESWEYEIVEQELETSAWGIRFWPKDCPEGMIELCWYPSGFGVCGTGLEQATLILDNGDYASMGYYDGSDAMSFCVFSMDYAAVNVSAYDCWEEYGQTVLQILRSVQLNQGVITEQEARNVIAQSGMLEKEWAHCRAELDPVEGVWTFCYYDRDHNDPEQTICVDWDGHCWRHGEEKPHHDVTNHHSGHHHDTAVCSYPKVTTD